mmetsp:Transcript_6518/g.13482  ORF Transcript_6518/g.13482 Transcript_6518/m.13482 type:complete len:173 (-) Transcript_6518:341-859(-)
MGGGDAIRVPDMLVTQTNPLGRHWDELPPSTRRFFHDAAALTPQLQGYGAPRPTPTSNEMPLINGSMRTFPDSHPSLGSVPNAVATGCPAIVYNQMDSSQWKSTSQATISEKEPTIKRRKEGKAMAPALFGAGDLYTPPVEVYMAPPGAPPTIIRDQRVFKHMGTLTRAGHW